MKRALYVAGLIIVIITIGGLFVSNYAVSYFLRSMGPYELISTKENTAGNNGVDEDRNHQSSTNEVSKNDKGLPSSSVKAGDSKPNSGLNETNKLEITGSQSAPNFYGKLDAKDTSKDIEALKPKEELKYAAEVSPDKAKEVEQSITVREKAQVVSVLLKKLSASELQMFLNLVGKGLSIEEKKEAKKVILQRLTEEEYNQLISIAAKYGLSQGKGYQESQKELVPPGKAQNRDEQRSK
ncbi:hypothetical protein GC093_18015 [Paenibacillus sp. LMG 31456]|uniref:Uncharacterized protein n=1 Tax=Paenibacillus foliorum TaxID=2654974 RepID=A0A972GRZ7_9BACL|nr:hypothetical protein [Paenibacillus foliorum]NOU95105.1 hypothetical protein [Paenibacillus foliorum]